MTATTKHERAVVEAVLGVLRAQGATATAEDPRDFWTIKGLSTRLGLSENRVRDLIRNGLPTHRVPGTRVRVIRKADYWRWIEREGATE